MRSLLEEKIQEFRRTSTVEVLLYETESFKGSHAHSLIKQLRQLKGIKATMFGEGKGFEGYGSKYAAVYPLLKKMNPHSLVVISDSRDVLINNPMHSVAYRYSAVEEFRFHFEELTWKHPGAIVISAEAQCCVSALTYVAPGDYYNKDGSRNQRSCPSGEAGCTWSGDDNALPWEDFMKNLALQHGKGATHRFDDVYLNAGLIAGKAQDLLKVIEKAEIGKEEDDQAVLTDFMYKNPDSIVLDYGQKLFGNNRGGLGGMNDESCVFELSKDEPPTGGRLTHSKTLSSPLFLHSPGGFLECQDALAVKLGVVKASSLLHRRLRQRKNSRCNYGGSNYGGSNYGGNNYRNGCKKHQHHHFKAFDSPLYRGLVAFKNKHIGGVRANFWTRSAGT